MKKSYLLLISFLVIITLIIITPIAATSHTSLPASILAIQKDNQLTAEKILLNVSFITAFLAGALTLLSPCVLPLFPAFFAYTFKEKKQITKMTVLFFIGFSSMFIVMGLLAAFLGEASIIMVQENATLLVQTAGAALVVLGITTLFGKGFSGFILKTKPVNDILGMLLYGVLFAMGWTACVGPILAGILIMAALYHNYFIAVILMFFYSLGIFLPLFILALCYDKTHLEKRAWIKGKLLTFTVLKKQFQIQTTEVLAGVLLIATGIVFILFKGTGIINSIDPLGTKQYFYSIQRIMMDGSTTFTITGVLVLAILGWLIYNITQQKTTEQKESL